jgi:hypothetical protein
MKHPLAVALDSSVTKLRLPPAEWDFRALIHKNPTLEQRQELCAAVRYEYARESESLRKLADEFAELPDEDLEQKATLSYPKRGEFSLFTALPFWNCVLWPRFFPRIPWLCIPPEERLRRVRSYVKANRLWCLTINELDEPTELELPKRGRRKFIDMKENLIVSIDWAAANNDEIVCAFEKWVRNSRPQDIPEPRGDASRQNVRAAFLTRLAVTRLLHHYPHQAAVEIARNHGLRMPHQQSNALKMRSQFKADLCRIFRADLFDGLGRLLIPRDELPRCWITWSERCQKNGY